MSTWNVLVLVIYRNYRLSKMYTKTKSTAQKVNQAKGLSIALMILFIYFFSNNCTKDIELSFQQFPKNIFKMMNNL